MKNKGLIFSITTLLVIFLIAGILYITTYNSLIDSLKKVDESKAQINAVCQRRLDLIPVLVQTVKGYAKHEKETFEKVIKARQNAQKSLTQGNIAGIQASQNELSRSVRGIFALVENYPDLKASTNFLALQDQLEGTENRINIKRQIYNVAVREYNAKITKFPGVLVAPLYGMKERPFFKAKQKAFDAVKFKF